MPKISDFGSNKMKNFAEKFNIKNLDPEENPGTLIYMPPESCLEDYEVNSSCDVYAYGLIVYQILEDKPYLFDEPSRIDFKRLHNGERPEFTEKTPKPFRKLIKKCWSQKAEERPNFSQILKQLKKCKFITEKVDEDEFYEYLETVDFDEFTDGKVDIMKRSITYDEFINGRKKTRMRSNAVREPPKLLDMVPIAKAASQDSPALMRKGRKRRGVVTVAPDLSDLNENELAAIKIDENEAETEKIEEVSNKRVKQRRYNGKELP